MKLRNKTTGEIGYFISTNWNETSLIIMDKNGVQLAKYNSLAELNSEWEDYEEPKEYYCIDWTEPSGIYKTNCVDERDDFNKEIGNYFSSREEAELAVRKLKVWKRLKDSGFVFCGKGDCLDTIKFDYGPAGYNRQDFNILFGGEG